MALPGVQQTIRDGALGLLALGSDLHVKVGLATSGPVNEVVITSDPQTIRDTFTSGELVEAGVHFVSVTGLPVALIRVAQATAGSLPAFTQTGSGPLITADGATPNDAYQVRVEILDGGNVGTATFRYSLDGGDTWSTEIATAASYVIPDTGITISFPSGTYVAGELYSSDAVPPAFDTTGLAAAIDVALAMSQQWRCIHVVGYAATGAASATVAAAVAAKMTMAETQHRYTYAIIEAANDTDSALIAAFESFASPRIMVCAGFTELVSAVSGRIYKRHAAWSIVARIMSVAVSRDPGAVMDGPLDASVVGLYRDEQKTEGLDAARFATLRTFYGRPGFYVTRGRMMAAPGSDFGDVTRRQVMDVASRVAYEGLLLYVNVDLQLDPDTGHLVETEARGIEAFVLGRLRTALLSPVPPDASDVEFIVKRDVNILSTETLIAKTRVLPKGYARFIENEIAFRNPALEAPQE